MKAPSDEYLTEAEYVKKMTLECIYMCVNETCAEECKRVRWLAPPGEPKRDDYIREMR